MTKFKFAKQAPNLETDTKLKVLEERRDKLAEKIKKIEEEIEAGRDNEDMWPGHGEGNSVLVLQDSLIIYQTSLKEIEEEIRKIKNNSDNSVQ